VKHLEVERVKWWNWSVLSRKCRRKTSSCYVLRNIQFREISLMNRNVNAKMTIRGVTFNKILKYVRILCFDDRASLDVLVNKVNLVHNFSYCVYFFSLHVSGDYVSIIRRNNCAYATLGTRYSVWITVWCIPDSHPYRITSTKRRINTVVSPDDGHIFAQNVEDIDILRKTVHQAGFIYKINPLQTKRRLLYLKTQFVPRSKHFPTRL